VTSKVNRYTARGLVDDLIAGQQVLVVSRDQNAARRAFDELRQSVLHTFTVFDAPLTGVRFHHVNAEQRIDFEGGCIQFTDCRRAPEMRGRSYDVVYVDDPETARDARFVETMLYRIGNKCELIRP
jgi:hypothetical protein